MAAPGAKRHDPAAVPARARLQRGEGAGDAVAVAAVAQEAPGGPHPLRVRDAGRRQAVLPRRLASSRQGFGRVLYTIKVTRCYHLILSGNAGIEDKTDDRASSGSGGRPNGNHYLEL